MATLLKPEKRPNGLYRRISFELNGKRAKLSLGTIDEKSANKVKDIVEQLELIKFDCSPIPLELQKTLNKLQSSLRSRLEKVGLIEKQVKKCRTMPELFDAYCQSISGRLHPKTTKNYRSALRVFEEFFSDRSISSITTGDLEDFANQFRTTKERSTVGTYVKRGAAAFRYAFKHDWIAKNPFDGMNRAGLAIKKSEEKQKRINEILTKELLQSVLTCPKVLSDPLEDAEWNALIAIVRYTGCRISEALILRWSDVDFEKKRIRIRGKRDGIGAGPNAAFKERACPLFKELEPYLMALRSLSLSTKGYMLNAIEHLEGKIDEDQYDSDGKVIKQGRWRRNVRKTWGEILKRNQIPDWPQIFHAIRQFRINELELSGIRKAAIRAWTGNSEATADKYYSVVLDEDFENAKELTWGETGVFEIAQTVSGCTAKKKGPQELIGPSQFEPIEPIPNSPDRVLSGVFSLHIARLLLSFQYSVQGLRHSICATCHGVISSSNDWRNSGDKRALNCFTHCSHNCSKGPTAMQPEIMLTLLTCVETSLIRRT